MQAFSWFGLRTAQEESSLGSWTIRGDTSLCLWPRATLKVVLVALCVNLPGAGCPDIWPDVILNVSSWMRLTF